MENADLQPDSKLQWVQLNVGLVRHEGSALPSARAVFAEIEPLIDRWRAAGSLDCYFFMRKPPDIRMRFLLVDSPELVTSELSARMLILESQNLIGEFFFSEYEAETERFGGLEAMKCVHTYFDRDTTNWFALERLCQQNLRSIPPEILLPTLFHDLFHRTLGDEISVFKTWQSLGNLTPLASGTTVLAVEVLTVEELCRQLSATAAESAILDNYSQDHHHLAEELMRLGQLNRLSGDIHEILATIALFSFNRHGFPGERSSVIVAATIRTLELRFRLPT